MCIWHKICFTAVANDKKHTTGVMMDWQVTIDDDLFYYQLPGVIDDEVVAPESIKVKIVEIPETPPEKWDEWIYSLFRKSNNNPNFIDTHGVPLLFHAINLGTTASARMLLEAGANANFVSWQGTSPWLLAVKSGDMQKIRLLEQFNADISIQDNCGNNALHFIAMQGKCRLFHYLLHHDPVKSALAVNRWGDSLLHLTTAWNHLLQTRICLTHTDIPINARNRAGETAFLKALKCGHFQIARVLKLAGADSDLPDNSGITPMKAACAFIMKRNDEGHLAEILPGAESISDIRTLLDCIAKQDA